LSVTLKLATSLDGRIATRSGESRWITGAEAREQVHRLRAEHDAIVVGIGTALADDPELSVRLPGHEGRQPARVVLDSRQRLPLGSKLVRTAGAVPTFLVSTGAVSSALLKAGVVVLAVGAAEGRPDLAEAVGALAAGGLHKLFVEGGGEVAASFLRLGLVQRIEWFRAPIILGGDARPCMAALALEALASAPRFRRTEVRELGPDLWERYVLED
jgi:diaminohydroxyphosphoribosylaminopyrimidine deaminase/5-amino-6-(5-phosphoribosylamino)uracil reductase